MKLIISALAATVLVGCSSVSVPVNQAETVPADRYFWTQKPKTANPGKLVVIRDKGLLGAGSKADVTIDQTPLAALKVGEKAEVLLDPDSYVIDIDVAYITDSANQDIKAGQTYYYRIAVDNNAVLHLRQVKKID